VRRPDGLAERVPLAPRTTLEVGGEARFLLEATTEDAVLEALAWARAEGLGVVVLGGGSNVLVADRGLDALVLVPAVRGVEARDEGGRVLVTAGAGEPWDALVARAVASGWAGLECLSGIPGSAGATPIQNVGAYGQDVSETIVSVDAVERATGQLVALSAASLGFGYRDSALKRDAKDRYVITRVTFALTPGGAPAVRYAELTRYLENEAILPTLESVRAAVIALRRRKSMVIDPADPNRRSAGSFFTNPVVGADHAADVLARARALGAVGPGEAMPAHSAPGGRVKLAAGWLIERAGLTKGAGDGRVGLSTRHALALVNRGGATAAEVLAFARAVRDEVLAKLGVRLVPEPVVMGFRAEEIGDLYEE
jgi:UDP-N-acetylmuramate dehydrogenase